MALIPGTRLGPYEVTTQIGVGGMGEVYRATDTSLKRAVAIKVLPELLAADVERLARFQREAEVLASLNHPNIGAIYGLERSGGTTALVMEMVEGPTLADRIAGAPIPIDEVLSIAKQIAEALEAAHEQGIIHRDLKPANVKVRPDGMVKVLDFGLAKAMEPAPRWVGYTSNESGRNEIYIRPFAAPAPSGAAANPGSGQWQVSTAGGIAPRWRPDGKELYYIGPDGQMMAAPIAAAGTTLEPGAPVSLFPTRIYGGGVDIGQGLEYDVARDGRFLINTVLDDDAAPITILQNWNPESKP